MVDATHISFAANDRSYFSLLKKEIHRIAEEAGIIGPRLNELDIIVAEITSNLFKYGDGGEILMGAFSNNGEPYVELISIDSGPGIANPARMMQDGVSTTNTMGHGLGSIKRLSDVFELFSLVGWGTVLLSRVYNDPKAAKNNDHIIIRPIVVAKPGETTSGDGMAFKKNDKYIKIMLADGLGHGPDANLAINEAEKAFKVFPDYGPTDTLRFIHNSIKKTRGAVMNIVGYDYSTKMWSSTGIGNIAARMIGPTASRNHMSYNGIVGHNIPGSINDQEYSSDLYNIVVLCSDGIKTRWELNKYPNILKHDLTVLSAALYKDHARKTDDMSVITIKVNK